MDRPQPSRAAFNRSGAGVYKHRHFLAKRSSVPRVPRHSSGLHHLAPAKHGPSHRTLGLSNQRHALAPGLGAWSESAVWRAIFVKIPGLEQRAADGDRKRSVARPKQVGSSVAHSKLPARCHPPQSWKTSQLAAAYRTAKEQSSPNAWQLRNSRLAPTRRSVTSRNAPHAACAMQERDIRPSAQVNCRHSSMLRWSISSPSVLRLTLRLQTRRGRTYVPPSLATHLGVVQQQQQHHKRGLRQQRALATETPMDDRSRLLLRRRCAKVPFGQSGRSMRDARARARASDVRMLTRVHARVTMPHRAPARSGHGRTGGRRRQHERSPRAAAFGRRRQQRQPSWGQRQGVLRPPWMIYMPPGCKGWAGLGLGVGVGGRWAAGGTHRLRSWAPEGWRAHLDISCYSLVCSLTR